MDSVFTADPVHALPVQAGRAGRVWPSRQLGRSSLAQCLTLALLVHVLLVLVLGNTPGGSARPGEGVWGAINIRLQGEAADGQGQSSVDTEIQSGPRGQAAQARWGGWVRPPDDSTAPGAARQGRWQAPANGQAVVDTEPPGVAAQPEPLTAAPTSEPAARSVPVVPAPVPAVALTPLVPPVAATVAAPPPVLSPAPAPAPARVPTPSQPPVQPLVQTPVQTSVQTPIPAPIPAPVLAPAAPELPAPRRLRLAERPASIQPLPAAALPSLPVDALSLPAFEARTLPVPVAESTSGPALPATASAAPPVPPSPRSITQVTPVPAGAGSVVAASRDPALSGPTPQIGSSRPVAGLPDAGAKVGHDVATAPAQQASAPRLILDLVPRRGGAISAQGSRGLLPLLPHPPEGKSKLAEDIEKAAKTDCRQAYASMGLLAAVPLAFDALRDKGCRW